MSRKKILVIEDEAVCAQLVRLILFKKPIDVVVAADGEQGIKTARDEKPDLIFLDLMLPKVNGYEVMKVLKRDPATASIPVVVISARAGEDRKKMILETGCDEFIAKPFKVAKIKEVVKRFIG